jgi:hypothetical protein
MDLKERTSRWLVPATFRPSKRRLCMESDTDTNPSFATAQFDHSSSYLNQIYVTLLVKTNKNHAIVTNERYHKLLTA